MNEFNPTYLEHKEPQTLPMRWNRLTPRERQVASLICQQNGGRGYTNPQIADQLGISRETVKIHVRNILYKFDLHSKAELRRSLSKWEFVQIK
jgi:DNA-binding CsgD family transcriptional regulator